MNFKPTELKSQVVERMKQEVRDLVCSYRIPVNVTSFAELHDYIDANELGGFCDDIISTPLIEALGGWDEPDRENPCQAYANFVNDCQYEVDDWIRGGGIAPNRVAGCPLDASAPIISSEAAWRHLAADLLYELQLCSERDRCVKSPLVQRAQAMFKNRTR